MPKNSVPPSTTETAFECPHCGAYTTQYWYSVIPKEYGKNVVPKIPSTETRNYVVQNGRGTPEEREKFLKWCDAMDTGLVFFDNENTGFINLRAHNINLSKCYNCGEVAVWVHRNLLFPSKKLGPLPNLDLPAEIRRDFEEARAIVGDSPRGAAALLRLCLQKLCIHLGEKGRNIDDDIASLVSKGLNPLVQKALDIVRVIGNEAVHPGVIELTDDQGTALQLLTLINSIADQMITHPKNIQDLYGKLPASKREAIEKRDSKDKNN